MTRCLTALRVGNFKAFAETQRIPLKPITLIFGPNSAGKSSFIHSLALAHEAHFGREKRSLSRLDVHHTEIGGTAIDLGGFRQYVHRGQLNKRVEWGAELKVSAMVAPQAQRAAQLLAPVSTVAVNILLGIELDDQDRPVAGAEPRVEAVEVSADGTELLRMSHRRAGAQVGALRLDRLASEHAVFRQVLKAIVETATTSEEMRPEDFDGANEAIAQMLPELVVRVDPFFPSAVELPRTGGADIASASMLFPVSKGNREEDIAQAVRFYLPRTLNDLIKGLADALSGELKQLQYLGPLRSFPPRHMAFAEHEDANWFAGGGYAWDVVRRNDGVRAAVNGWLGSSKLKTPYKLIVRSLVALDQMQGTLEAGLQRLQDEGLDMEHEAESRYTTAGSWPVIKDVEAEAERLLQEIEASDADRLRELVLIDQRTNTVVTHRDVGIGISQVLPVLVMAYGSQGKLLAMEQPEIHLHPALQAELGDVFIEAALGERGNTFILETHSEHLVLRLMRRIREGTLSKDDVGVVFVESLSQGSRTVELHIDEEGDFVDELARRILRGVVSREVCRALKMLVPFVIDADGVAPDPAWTPAQQRACHKNLLDVWQSVGLLVHDGDSFIGSRLHQSVEKLPQNLRALWKEVLERVPLRNCGATWGGAVTPAALHQIADIARLALVDDACAEVEFGIATDADGQCLQIDSKRRVDIYRLLMANQAPAFKDAIARSDVHVEAGETFRAIWDSRFEALAAAPLKRVAIVDRFAVSRHYEQDLANGLSGLERFMRLLDTAANGPRHVTVFSAWTAELHGRAMADIEADVKLLFGRLPVRQIKRIKVVMAPNTAFRVDGHDRFVRFEDYVWDIGTGIQILEGAFAASRSAATFKAGVAVAGYKRVETAIAGHSDAKSILVI